jgi:hypothetical protein
MMREGFSPGFLKQLFCGTLKHNTTKKPARPRARKGTTWAIMKIRAGNKKENSLMFL